MPSESKQGHRAILTEREQEILRGEADVSDSYYYRVVSRVRDKIERLEEDLKIFDKHHEQLAQEIRETICDRDGDYSSPPDT